LLELHEHTFIDLVKTWHLSQAPSTRPPQLLTYKLTKSFVPCPIELSQEENSENLTIQTKQGLKRSQRKKGNSSCYKARCCEKIMHLLHNEVEGTHI
jgi:hypothetical protein